MSVRGMSHAAINRRIINHDKGGTFLVCAWSDCDKDAITLYEVRSHEHIRQIPCDSPDARHSTMAFCTERHKQYHLASTGWQANVTAERNRGRVAGMLPPGWRQTIQ